MSYFLSSIFSAINNNSIAFIFKSLLFSNFIYYFINLTNNLFISIIHFS